MLHKLTTIFLMGCTLFLTHCMRLAPESHIGSNQALASPFTMPAQAYLALAQNQSGTEKQNLELMAAGRAIYEGQWRYGVSIINHCGTMFGELADEKNILLAKVELIQDHAHAAIKHLAAVQNHQRLSLFYQAQYHDMLAYAYQTTGAITESVVERIALESLLPDMPSKMNNRRVLWLSLTQLSQAELDTLFSENTDNTILQGWIALAQLSRKYVSDPQTMLDDIQAWRSQYPTHPGNQILPSSKDKLASRLLPQPKHMAVMLPLTGPLAGPGQAIQDGFMAAYQARGQIKNVSVRVYNTYQADVKQVYHKAIEEGADYVVGPLSKSDVAVVAKMNHPVPTILLNDAEHLSDHLAFQFGLSPMNEARQLAVKAHKSGYTHALIISPSGAWGEDVVKAFSTQWAATGGHVIDRWQYTPQDDLSTGIRHLLHASDDQAKIRPTNVQTPTDNTYKRRQDFDVVILIAYPSKARQIMPLLRYYFAGNVPIYATSAVYSGTDNTARDRDLNGIIFCDMPWVFTHQMEREHHWAEQLNSYNRLYALGMDSYALGSQLNHLMLFPAMGLNDKSGLIYLSHDQQLSRILVFAQFKEGLARKLDGEQDKSIF